MVEEKDIEMTLSVDDAIEFFEKSKDSGFFTQPYLAYLNLSQAYVLKGWLGKAQQELRAGLKRYPKTFELETALETIEGQLN